MRSDTMRMSGVVALTLVVGTFFTAQEVFMDLARGHSGNVPEDVVNGLEIWAVWALLTPLVLAAARRWPLDAKPMYRPLAVHLVLAAGLALAHNVITLGLQSLAHAVPATLAGYSAPPPLAMRTVRCEVQIPGLSGGFHTVWSASCATLTAFVWGLFVGVLFYAVVVVVYTALRFRGNAQTLEAELTHSKLDTLRSQLQPHFLFNTLNAISVFVSEDAEKAQQMLLRLSTLLRRSLDENSHEVPLRHELAYVNDYLDIQRERFGDQLAVSVEIDPAALDLSVPVFLLQPLLENAIEHGKADGRCATVVVRASREADRLHISLLDDGPGPAGDGTVREGIGLGNTRARLFHLYGSRASVTLSGGNGTSASRGARVDIRLPLRLAPSS